MEDNMKKTQIITPKCIKIRIFPHKINLPILTNEYKHRANF